MTRKATGKTPESLVKDACKQVLDMLGWYHWPIIQDFRQARGEVGLPDRMAIKEGRVIAVEIKAPKKKQSENQIKFQGKWERAGGEYICVDDASKLYDYLTQEGMPCRELLDFTPKK